MTRSQSDHSDKRAFPTLERIDIICDEFESRWRKGERPDIKEFLLSAAERDRAELLNELVRLDVEYRSKQGEAPSPDDYISRFADFTIDTESVFANSAVQGASKRNDVDTTMAYQPRSLGVYQLLERLGKGGMGEVYKARHEKLRRTVAVKILSSEALEHPEALARFQREMRIVGALDHPNVVRAMDANEVDGTHFLAMEYVDGQDLSKIVKANGALPVEQAVDYIRQTAIGLAYAQSQGVVHRDIKPANLLVNTEGQVKILDLGLARLEREIAQQTTDFLVTQTAQVMGTFDYMSPEQAVGTRNVDHRTDIYSLGCTLFALLTGKPMFKASSGVEKVMAHRNEPPPNLCELREDIPEELDTIFQRMVAKHADDRFASMEEVVAALDGLLSPETEQPTRRSAAALETTVFETSPPEPEDDDLPAPVTAARPSFKLIMWSAVAVGVLVAVAGLVAEYLSATNGGKVRFDSELPETIVEVFEDGKLVATVVTGDHAESAWYRAGDYEIRLRNPDDSVRIEGGEFELARGDQHLVRIMRIPLRQRLTSPGWIWTGPTNVRGLNSSGHDVSPTVTEDGLLLLFSSTRHRGNLQYDLWSCERASTDAFWSDPVLVNEPVNGEADSSNPSVSFDGLTLIYSTDRPGGVGNRDLWISTRASRQSPWEDPTNLGTSVNTNAAEDSAVLSRDGLTLIYSSLRAGGEGGYDLWQATRQTKAGRFGNVKNLGAVVNSSARELSPTLSTDGLAMWFASDRPDGKGRLDLWMCLRDDVDKPWGRPINLGKSICTNGNEETPAFASDDILYFVSYGDDTAVGGRDIHATQLVARGAEEHAMIAKLVDPATIPTDIANPPDSSSSEHDTPQDDAPPLAKFPFDTEAALTHQKTWADYRKVPVQRNLSIFDDVSMPFVLIPAGEFEMGTKEGDEFQRLRLELEASGGDEIMALVEEMPQHLVTLTKPFYMGKYEVTRRQWHGVMDENDAETDLEHPNHPVANVTWLQVQAFVKRLNVKPQTHGVHFALPTEAQWEFASRAGTTTDHSHGLEKVRLKEFARFGLSAEDGPDDVGKLKSNAWGLYDTQGNIAEWCRDNFGRNHYTYSGRYDPEGPNFSTLRVVRGGSFQSRADQCRTRSRGAERTDIEYPYVGFRLVATVPKPDNE